MLIHGTRKLLLALMACAAVQAAPPLTTIQDTLYKADGTPFSGFVTISWKTFVAADSSSIPMNTITAQISNGLLRIRLVPTTNASAGAYYLARFNADGKTQFSEIWSVPASAAPVLLRDVRVASAPAAGPGGSTGTPSTILLSDVQGLSYEEIADVTNSNLGTVKSRLSRARAKLREFLQAHGELLPEIYRLDSNSA